MLGGGGYTVRNVARTWTYETATLLGIDLDPHPDLPYHDYFDYYGPHFELDVRPTNMDNHNSRAYLEGILCVSQQALFPSTTLIKMQCASDG